MLIWQTLFQSIHRWTDLEPWVNGAMDFVAVSMTAPYVSPKCSVHMKCCPAAWDLVAPACMWLYTINSTTRVLLLLSFINQLQLSTGLLSFFVPCYQFGKNAEAVGHNCIVCGLLCLFFGCGLIGLVARDNVRYRIREQKGIDVSSD